MEDDDLTNLDIMPPPLFSRSNIPGVYKYPRSPRSLSLCPLILIYSSYKQNKGLIATNGRLAYRYIFRNKFITMIDKDAPSVPTSPSPNLDPISSLSPATQLCIRRLQDLFSEREITTRRAIYNTYLSKHGPGRLDEKENWRPILRFALPYVCYMWKSGPFRDAHVVFGLDPRKESRWAGYQTAIFSFRDTKEMAKRPAGEEEEGKSHLFTGQEVGTRNVSYCFKDIVDPMLRKILDEAVLREKFHVLSLPVVLRLYPSNVY